jgi:hypothetical protein
MKRRNTDSDQTPEAEVFIAGDYNCRNFQWGRNQMAHELWQGEA